MPSSSYDLAFVDRISASATVRLDLHSSAAGWLCLADGTQFPPPPLDRVVANSQMADGDLVPAASYRNRTITLSLELGMHLDPDAQATQLQSLMRELDRPVNFLRYRTDTTTPVFFRTLRSGPDSVDWDPFQRRAVVSLMAEPFAYGPKETLSGTTVTNDPAAGANGMFLDITSPKGDVETPLTLTITDGTTGLGETGRLDSAIAIRRRGTVANTPLFLQAEAMSQGTDTATQPNSAVMSGSGNNYSRCTFATATSGQRRIYTTTTFPTASVDARGTYRVFVRGRQNTGGDSIDVRLQWGDVNNVILGPIVRWPGNVFRQYVDLGVMQIPVGFDPVHDGSGVELSTEGTYIDLYVRRNSGSGTFDMDFLLFVPADPTDGLTFHKWPAVQLFSSDAFVSVGGAEPRAYCLSNTNTIRSTETIETAGTGVMLAPGRTNRVFFFRNMGGGPAAAGTSDSVTASHILTPSYFPRYLSPVKPVAT